MGILLEHGLEARVGLGHAEEEFGWVVVRLLEPARHEKETLKGGVDAGPLLGLLLLLLVLLLLVLSLHLEVVLDGDPVVAGLGRTLQDLVDCLGGVVCAGRVQVGGRERVACIQALQH